MTDFNVQTQQWPSLPLVELFLNGTSLGVKPKPADDAPRRWQVTYAPGTLRAVGTDNGKTVATDELRTAGPAAKIVLTTDDTKLPNDWDNVSYVTASVMDANGTVVPSAQDLISFSVKGPGSVVATDNGDVSNHDSFQAPQHHVYQGTCIAVLRATAASGAITLTASAPGLTSGTVTIQAAAPSPVP